MVDAKGFYAKWKVVAGGGSGNAASSGLIKSPNYPKPYPANVDKLYNLEVATGSKIELTFTEFDVEHEENCGYDWVEVKDGKNSQKYCGNTKPSVITSTSNKLQVKFHSDYYLNTKGFTATWKKV